MRVAFRHLVRWSFRGAPFLFLRDLVPDFVRECIWFVQRGYRGYADCDVWSLDMYLSKILGPALRQLERTRHGYPAHITESEWKDILITMAKGFEKEFEDFETCSFEEVPDNKHLELFVEYFRNLWD